MRITLYTLFLMLGLFAGARSARAQCTVLAGPDQVLNCTTPSVTLGDDFNASTPVFEWTGPNGFTASIFHPVVSIPGLYSVTMTDTGNGCTSTDEVLVTQLEITTVVNPILCFGGADGSITLTLTGGNGPYTYLWSDGTTDITATDLAPGNYEVTVTDADGCPLTASATMTQPAALNIATAVTNVSCNGGADGAIYLTVTGGVSPYSYMWSNGMMGGSEWVGAPAGPYTATVTDANGCTKTSSTTLTEPTALALNFLVSNVTCNGGNNGTINLTVTGGTPAYTYIWANGVTTQHLNNVVAGTYTVTVTDIHGCTKSASTTITQPIPINLSFSITPISCFGGSNGFIDLTVTGGVPSYTYDWSNDGSETPDNDTQDLSGVTAGAYTVTVTDSNGCSKTITAIVTQPPALLITTTNTPILCNGGSNGAIDLTVTGGVPGYTYTWSNGATTQDVTNLPAGTYTVTVTDSNGCTKTSSATMTQPPALNLSSTTIGGCIGANGGSINLTVTGGVPAYTYLWTNGSTTQDLNNLSTGAYTVTVTDANGCAKTASATISASPPLTINYTTSELPCGGTIDLTIGGGTPPFSYDWSINGPQIPDNDPQDLSDLASGTYTVTVTDSFGCTEDSVITLTLVVDVLTVITTATTNVLCFGGSDGALIIAVSGGLPPYSYDWSNDGPEAPDDDTKDLSGLPGGIYTVTVTDANGCTRVHSVTINAPAQIIIGSPAVTPVSCFGGSDGAIDIGGLPGYTYEWSNGSTSQNQTNLQAGTYTVTITDTAGCTQTTIVEVLQAPALAFLPAIFCDGVVFIQPTGGIPPYSYQWNTGSNSGSVSLPPGNYSITVTDAHNCTVIMDVYVSPNPPPCTKITGNLKLDGNSDCLPDASETGIGNLFVTAVGANTYYGLSDANGQYSIPVAPGSYTVSVVPPPNSPLTLCQSSIDVDLPLAGDTAVADFALQDLPECPAMTVDLSTPMLRRCFSSNYFVHYCNNGVDPATDAYLTLQFDQYLNIIAADLPYTFLGNNTYRFNLGTVAPYECGDFKVKVYVSCSSVPGQTHCTEAHIYPDTLCVPPNAQWSGAALQVQSRCADDSLHFVLKNIGAQDMSDELKYIVIEDGVMGLQSMSPPLAAGDSMVVSVLANGSTWRMEATQEPFFPGQSVPVLSVEGCPATSSFSTGILSQFPVNDADPWIDVDCTVNTGSYDPNDKQGFPIGYGDSHYVKPETEIEYMIRFQNTGTDTAFHVVVLDTLSSLLDPSSLQLGASSHPYQFSLQGPGGVLVFDFQDIMLPDSNVNEPESHGFIKIRIAPRAGIPNETDIFNNAAIYFDFNDPVFTNTTTHRIGENFVLVDEWHPQVPEYQVQVSPNPVQTEALIVVKGAPPNGEYSLHLYNLTGSLIKTLQSHAPQFRIQREGIAAGAYLFTISRNGVPAGWGKIIMKE